jgi:hypothetical protein
VREPPEHGPQPVGQRQARRDVRGGEEAEQLAGAQRGLDLAQAAVRDAVAVRLALRRERGPRAARADGPRTARVAAGSAARTAAAATAAARSARLQGMNRS